MVQKVRTVIWSKDKLLYCQTDDDIYIVNWKRLPKKIKTLALFRLSNNKKINKLSDRTLRKQFSKLKSLFKPIQYSIFYYSALVQTDASKGIRKWQINIIARIQNTSFSALHKSKPWCTAEWELKIKMPDIVQKAYLS